MKLEFGQAWQAGEIPWQEIGADGTKYALLEGRRDVLGQAFSYAFFIPAGFWDPAHWHTQDARVFVVSGTLYLGYGDELNPEMNPEQLQAFPAGSFVLVPANARHFDGSHEDTLIVGVANGVWATHYVDSSIQPSAGTIS
jgi:hypothetical protein